MANFTRYAIVAIGLVAAGSLHAQDVALARAGNSGPPSVFRIGVNASARALALASLGGLVGSVIDRRECRRLNADRTGFIFDFCAPALHNPTGAGWFGGSVLGATWGAMNGAVARGCPPKKASSQAFLGGIFGIIPSVLFAARGGDNWPPGRTAVVAAAPLLAAVGATSAVANCR